MKRAYELTEEELLTLNDDETARLVDYECAVEGVPMLPPSPGPEPRKDFPGPDAQCFEIAGVKTIDAAHAARILDAISSGNCVETTYTGSDYNNRYLKSLPMDDYNYPKIESKSYHSAEQWDRIKKEHGNFTTLKKEWDAKNNEYTKAVKERAAITEDVYGRISEARQRAYDRDRLREDFAKYLELAEGNRTIAMKFLEKVKDLSEFPELRDEFIPPVSTEKSPEEDNE